MDHFDITTGVLDSWDLLNPVLARYKKLTKEILQDNNSKGTSSASVLIKTTSHHTPALNSISAGYYPLSDATYKICPSAYDKPLIQVTVIPKPQTTSINQRRRKSHTKKHALPILKHSTSTKSIYVLLPGRRKDKIYAIDTSNAKIYKEINDNTLLSECIIKSFCREMNKSRKKSTEKSKEKREPLKYVPECSAGCAYWNFSNKTKTASPDRSGLASPRSPVRSSYKVATKLESNTLISSEGRRTDGRQVRSPDRVSLKDTAQTKSPTRTSRQKTQINIYQNDKVNGREEAVKSPDRFSYMSDKRSIESVIAETKRRSPERFEERERNASRPGRIRITGRLGLTKDDKCILKCDATLDDKPIETQFQGMDCAVLPECFKAYKEDYGSTRKRDANVQAKESPTGVRFYNHSATGKESQGTQVDFQFLYSLAKGRTEDCRGGKILQKCACVNTVDNVNNASDDEDTGFVLKNHQSPIIVISVYSKNGVPSDNKGNIKQMDIKVEQKKDDKKLGRSRSPSPTKNSKKIGSKKSEGRVTASSSKKTIREAAKRETRTKVNQSQSKSVIRSTTITKSNAEKKTNKSKTQKSLKTPPQSRRSKSPEIISDEGKVNENMIKKAIIEDFTTKYADQIMQRKPLDIPLTKHNVSNITIDIEGDSDYYNVKLEQDIGKLNTELTVRKPNRGKRAGEVVTRETDSTSLENFLYVQPDDGHRKRSFSQTLMYDGTALAINSENLSNNELNVKDSIEISHRREHRASLLDDNRERSGLPKEVNTEYSYLASNKHYQGDNCRISDPNTRDKEIRRLLGIEKGIKQPQSKLRRSKTTTLIGKTGQVPLHSTCDSFSSTTQTKNSKTVLKKLDINERMESFYDTIQTVKSDRPLLYQLMWNQNIQLLYQLTFRKHKPIVLTRHQYAKLKKTIFNTLIQKHNNSFHAKCLLNRRPYTCSRHETKNIILHYDKDCQTEKVADESSEQVHAHLSEQLLTMKSDIDTYSICEIPNCGDGSTVLSKEKDKICADSSHRTFEQVSHANWTQHAIKFDKYVHNVQRTVLIARDLNRPNSELFAEEYRRKATSVKVIQYKSIPITKQRVKLSSSDMIDYKIVAQYKEKNDSCSIHTIFKSHRKSITPNLGASANSLCDVSSKRCPSELNVFDDSINNNQKPKKPFLRRLISCLVFKISPVSQPKIPEDKHPSLNSSFDSYHISTSLGAMEMSSSMYDTSASFYSDHTITPIAKMKRGFFSSVRGFLGRKS